MNAPAVVLTFSYCRLVACTLHVVKPDWSTAAAVMMVDISTGPVSYIKKCVMIRIFRLRYDSIFVIKKNSSAKVMYDSL